MSTKQMVATADQAFAGRAYDSGLYGVIKSKGRPIEFLTKVDLGTPVIAVADALIKAATSTEMPNAATKTYVPGTVDSPLDSASLPSTTTIQTVDGAKLVWVLDVPRNLTAAVTHGSSVVACTITVTGYDQYRAKMVKTMAIAATGTSQAGVTAAAFKYIASIAITSAGNATTNTCNIGFGDVLGLPYVLAEKSDLLQAWFDDAVESSHTVVAAVTTSPATATTGDVRGTIDFNGTLNGSKKCKVWMHIADAAAATARGLLGVAQYAG